MPFTTAQLLTEINTDPKALGYAPLKAANNYLGLVAKLNATYAGVGVVFRTDVQAQEVLASLVWSEISNLITNNWLTLNSLLIPGVIDASKVTIRNIFAGLFPAGTFPLTSAALTAIAQKAAPSRAEELWGYGTIVGEQDVAHAINP
jgi:hypothetical protein